MKRILFILLFLPVLCTGPLPCTAQTTFIVNSFQVQAPGPSYDADAQTFFNAVTAAGGSLTSTEISAVNQLVLDYKAAGIWSSRYAIYPMVGGTSVSCSINLKNPGTYDLTFYGSPTITANGVAWNGSSQYALTGFVPSVGFTTTSSYMSYYSRTNNSNPFQYEIGSGSSQSYIDNIGATALICRYATNRTYFANGTYAVWVSNTDSRGYFSNCHTGSTTNGYIGGSNVISVGESVTLSTNELALGAANGGGGSIFYYSTRECAFAEIGAALTNTEVSDEYTAVQAFQTTLSRQMP